MSAAVNGAPQLSVDQWLCESGMRALVDSLIVDLIATRPRNVTAFIHAWSSPKRLSRSSLLSAQSTCYSALSDYSSLSIKSPPEFSREAEPSVDELRQLFFDAAASPFTFLSSEAEHAAFRGTRAHALSFSTDSLGPRCGRGNFGFVVPAQREKTLETENSAVAIKVARVQARWSLDEAFALQSITSHAKELWAEEERENARKGKKEKEEVGGRDTKRQEYYSDLVAGSKLVTCLVGDVMYDAARDALCMPLDFFPCTLAECISARAHARYGQCGSFSSCAELSDTCGIAKVQPNGEVVVDALFSPQELQHVARSLCRALLFLHAQCGLCHLDVKAGNILLSSLWPAAGEPFPRVVLGDFGLAQKIGAPIMQIGDFDTMAPEVYWASASDSEPHAPNRISAFSGACDVWSVGCVLLHMMDGLTYGAWAAKDVFTAMEYNFVSPAPRYPHLWPAELIDIVVRCFEREPRRRMSAEELLKHPFMNWNA